MPNDIPYNKKAAEDSDEYMRKNPSGPSFTQYLQGLVQKIMPSQATPLNQQAGSAIQEEKPAQLPPTSPDTNMANDNSPSQFGATYDYDMKNADGDEIAQAAIKKAALQRFYGNNPQ